MTIKKRWSVRVPFTNIKIRRSKTLRPGHGEKVVFHTYDEGLRFRIEPEKILRVLDEDRVSLEPAYGPNRFPEIYQGEEVKQMLSTSYQEELHERRKFTLDGYIRNISGRQIEIVWEPTLPSRARR